MRKSKEDEEEFYDASAVFTDYRMPLQEAIHETCTGLQLFLNNRFTLAKNLLKPYISESMYHSLGYSTLLYLQAFMTFDTVDLENANESLRKSLEVCQRFRHKKSFSTSWGIRKCDFSKYTIEEVHAELCYAECILEKALLTFIQDESLLSFVKGGMKIRASYYCYKECQEILETYQWDYADNFRTKSHFESGTRMGIGGFNLILANLPARILKLLEFIGFSGNKELGIRELELGTFQDFYSLRSPLCGITLLVYHLFTTYMLGTGDGDVVICQKILNQMLSYHPNGAIFLYFQARLFEVTGSMQLATKEFNRAIDCQHELKQIHHLCYWELMWCYAFGSDWLKAADYARTLSEGSKWSLSTYLYQRACFLLMVKDRDSDEDAQIATLINDVPLFKQRLAGKSLPVEKFVIKKCQRFKDQNNRLVVPAFEIFYIWNGFSIVGKRTDYLELALERMDQEFDLLNEQKDSDPFYDDNYCLLQLLRGVCRKCLGDHEIASTYFQTILQKESLIKDDFYLIPYTIVELAFIAITNHDTLTASQLLESAKTYNGYSLQSRLHFKIHSAFKMIDAILNPPSPIPLDDSVCDAIESIPSQPLFAPLSTTPSPLVQVKAEPLFFNPTAAVGSKSLTLPPGVNGSVTASHDMDGRTVPLSPTQRLPPPPRSPASVSYTSSIPPTTHGNNHQHHNQHHHHNYTHSVIKGVATVALKKIIPRKKKGGHHKTSPPKLLLKIAADDDGGRSRSSAKPLQMTTSHSSHDLGSTAATRVDGAIGKTSATATTNNKRGFNLANTSLSFLNLAAAYLPRSHHHTNQHYGGAGGHVNHSDVSTDTPSPSPSGLDKAAAGANIEASYRPPASKAGTTTSFRYFNSTVRPDAERVSMTRETTEVSKNRNEGDGVSEGAASVSTSLSPNPDHKKKSHHHHSTGANIKSLANSTTIKLRHQLATMLPQHQSLILKGLTQEGRPDKT